MSDRLQRAMAEGLITLLDTTRNHPSLDDLIDRKTIAIREALDAEYEVPNPCICGCCDGSDCGQTGTRTCGKCADTAFVCGLCDEDGEVEIGGMLVVCPECAGWPNRCPDCGGES